MLGYLIVFVARWYMKRILLSLALLNFCGLCKSKLKGLQKTFASLFNLSWLTFPENDIFIIRNIKQEKLLLKYPIIGTMPSSGKWAKIDGYFRCTLHHFKVAVILFYRNLIWLKLIFCKSNLKPANDPKICTIQPNTLVRVGMKIKGERHT